jgi:glycerate-2-kinase
MLLQATPNNRASELALEIYERVLAQMRGDRLVHQAVQRVGSELFVQGQRIDLSAFERVFVCGAGKASCSMAKGLLEVLGDRCEGGLIVTKEGHAEDLHPLEVVEAGHPLPNEASLLAGQAMLEFAHATTERDLVLFLLSGGASALMESPIDGVDLHDLVETNAALLASGQDIRAINAFRTQLSRIKAGGLARAFDPATVACLVLSDVIGNDLHTVGSAPLLSSKGMETTPPPHLLEVLPEAVRRQLGYPQLRKQTPIVEHFVTGSISLAIHEASDAARNVGLLPLPYSDPLQGEARVMARRIVKEAALQVTRQEDPFCMIFGGEPTVKLRGKGMGGRCQEMAATASLQLSKLRDTCFLAAGTDGSDGPTIAAGGLADAETCGRAARKEVSLSNTLRNNDSFRFLEASDGLIITGPTGSNVNDLVLVVRT